jgi:hypothetical protein
MTRTLEWDCNNARETPDIYHHSFGTNQHLSESLHHDQRSPVVHFEQVSCLKAALTEHVRAAVAMERGWHIEGILGVGLQQ